MLAGHSFPSPPLQLSTAYFMQALDADADMLVYSCSGMLPDLEQDDAATAGIDGTAAVAEPLPPRQQQQQRLPTTTITTWQVTEAPKPPMFGG